MHHGERLDVSYRPLRACGRQLQVAEPVSHSVRHELRPVSLRPPLVHAPAVEGRGGEPARRRVSVIGSLTPELAGQTCLLGFVTVVWRFGRVVERLLHRSTGSTQAVNRRERLRRPSRSRVRNAAYSGVPTGGTAPCSTRSVAESAASSATGPDGAGEKAPSRGAADIIRFRLTLRIRRRGRLHHTRLSAENMERPRSPASAR
jgi:hypothetical protein